MKKVYNRLMVCFGSYMLFIDMFVSKSYQKYVKAHGLVTQYKNIGMEA